ncbi:MAG: branched-chain amino acid ABC transporter ATP-binding protein/permease [Pseudolabrys sp.]|nr:branched-chain amino acid ABC transporter ATP-binding protein/permease [Pseudolabrys sp.]
MCVAVGLSLDSYPQYVIAIAMISMLAGVALVIVVGLARCITLASGSIMAVGAYASTLAMVQLGVSYVVALVLAIVAGGLAGWLIALPGTRFRGHNLAMVTLVFQSVCIILIREATWLTGGAEGIRVPPPVMFGWKIATDAEFLLVIGVFSAVMILLLTILVRGPFGKNLQAAAGNEVAAEAFGVSVPDYITAAFVVSSIAVALAGALAAPRILILDPESFGIMQSISMLAYPIVGGMHSIWGGLLGGGGLRVLPELLRPVADYQELFFATLVIVVVMFFPGGLIELLRRGTALVIKPNTKRGFEPMAAMATPASVSTVPVAASSERAEPLLVVEGIDKHFDALHAVNSANLLVPVGGIHGLIGPNGAGKTSLFNIISGFLDADGGRIEFAGVSLLELQARDRIRLGITRTFQHVAVFGQLSLVDNVIIGRGRNTVVHSMQESFGHFVGSAGAVTARREALLALESVGLASQAYSPAGSLSLGDQRRLEVARAIVSNPRLILLDEPVSGVAESEIEDLRQLLLRINAERKIAMLVVEHNIPFVVQICRTMSVMGAGRIVAEGHPADVISRPTVRQLYFGEETPA